MLDAFFNWLLDQQLLISSAIMFLLLLERKLLSQLSARLVYTLWALLPISLLLANLPEHLKPIQNDFISKLTITPNTAIMPQFTLTWFAIYGFISAALLITAVYFHYRFLAKLQLAPITLDHHSNQSMRLYQSNQVSSPMVVGVLNTKLVLPTNYQSHYDNHALALILEHESVHIKRKDNLINVIALSATILLWFNPVAWLGYASLRRIQELSCDEQVLKNKSTEQRILYSKALVHCASFSRTGLMAYSQYGDKNTMLQRLNQIKQIDNSSFIAKTALVIFTAGMLSSFAIAKQPMSVEKTKDYQAVMRVEPIYPIQAAEQGISGSVVLKYDILPSGATSNVSVVSAEPEGVFNREAKRALKKWQYAPSESGFKNALVQLDFALDENYQAKDLIEKIKVSSK
ncbi:energy transducer TonB [Pseudoalteromonas sp. S2721]|uniref:M56 family metallopeptidase n=1 Tax=Pseudoalteromonas sp. S2721 TaxID=579526 RepID=UPI00110BCF21|nr:M56 family metallopeptidase [Pseudoalteromonas sp. S2721]TMP16582.1 energy transducer TonB [Pseudoalteromonas sp. S2721]